MRCLITILAAAAALSAGAQAAYDDVQAKADRFFAHGEWGSAAALYGHQLRERPAEHANYGRAIVASEMLGDTLRSMQLLKQAMDFGAPLDSVLANVKKSSFQVGRGDMYEHFMLQACKEYKWLERPLDSYLLRYYAFRRNGPQMVAYAEKMLRQTPGNVPFLMILAEGCMLVDKPEQAVDAWLKVLQADPRNYLAILYLANYYDLTGDDALAARYYEQAMAIRRTPYVAEKLGQTRKDN